jgi:hypothetical protein
VNVVLSEISNGKGGIMSRSIRVVLTMVIALLVVGDASAGEGRLGRLFRGRAVQSAPKEAQYVPYQQQRYNREERDQYYRELYPKYYGGFHARTLQNYGYAPGDIGFRGGLSYPGMAW